ncbi:MAG: hypothetical protein ABI234_15900 [Ktedonobacteraceae bacterium]
MGVFNVGFLDTIIYYWILTIFIIIIFSFLTHVIGRIADHDHDIGLFFAFDAFGILLDHPKGQLLALG